eukprot:COSAG01_NODE_3143_length_6519_cov_61.635358_5_plen_133_part_00
MTSLVRWRFFFGRQSSSVLLLLLPVVLLQPFLTSGAASSTTRGSRRRGVRRHAVALVTAPRALADRHCAQAPPVTPFAITDGWIRTRYVHRTGDPEPEFFSETRWVHGGGAACSGNLHTTEGSASMHLAAGL